jgi:hypothetical protein
MVGREEWHAMDDQKTVKILDRRGKLLGEARVVPVLFDPDGNFADDPTEQLELDDELKERVADALHLLKTLRVSTVSAREIEYLNRTHRELERRREMMPLLILSLCVLGVMPVVAWLEGNVSFASYAGLHTLMAAFFGFVAFSNWHEKAST